MKTAISTDGQYVSAHFGRCPQYTILEIEGNKLIDKEVVDNPGHSPGFLPQYLKEKDIDCIVAGGMGMRAKELFREANIETILGIEGKIEETVNKILNGTLKGGESICKHGAGKGHGIEKEECDHN